MTPLRAVSFNRGLAVSGVTVWNLRCCATFAERPDLGVAWTTVEVGPAAALADVAALVPPTLQPRYAFGATAADENRWSVARRLIATVPALRAADVLLPNDVAEGWMCAELLRRRGRGPAVVGGVHSDDGQLARACGAGVTALEGVFAVSRRCVDVFAAHCPDRAPAAFLPYGVPTAAAPPAAADGPLRLVYCGRLDQSHKRILDLPAVASGLAAAGVDYRLEVAGAGPQEEAVRAALAEACGPRVEFRGRLAPADVPAFLAGQHVFLSLSAWEGTSISMLEAMGQGVVPVVTDVSGVRDAIEPGMNGWVVPVGDTAGMARILADLAANRPRLVRAARAAHAAVRDRYSLDASAAALAGVLRAAAAVPTRPPLRLTAAHPKLGALDVRWLPNPVARLARRVARGWADRA